MAGRVVIAGYDAVTTSLKTIMERDEGASEFPMRPHLSYPFVRFRIMLQVSIAVLRQI